MNDAMLFGNDPPQADEFSQADIQELLDNIDLLDENERTELLQIAATLEEREFANACRNNLIEFAKAMLPDYLVGAHHRHLAALLEQIETGEKDRITVSIAPRHGKQISHDTPVPTPTGYRYHGDLRPGDYVFGPDGKPVTVVAVAPETPQDVEVELTTGEVIRCHENHEWAVYSARKGYFSRPLEVIETKELEKNFWYGTKGTRGGRALWQLPDCDPLEYPESAQPLHPYALGAWLGDGSTSKPCITGVDEPIFERVAQVTGFVETMRVVHKDTGVTTVAYAGLQRGKRGQMSAALEKLGLTKSKFIPSAYKYTSTEQRLQLMAGLVDTDGHVEPHTGRCRIVTVCQLLAEDIREVAAGLGFRPYVTFQEPSLSSSGIQGKKRVYTVGFQPTCVLPTVLERKRVLKFSMRRKIAIADIRRAAPVLGRCIQVDREDGLYLVGRSHVPTHNSLMTSEFFTAWYLGKNPTKQVMLVSHTADLAVDFGRKVRNLIGTPEYQRIFPGVQLSADSKSAGRWSTNQGGIFYATGVGSSLAGRGADLLVIDDPISEQDMLAGNFDALEKAYEWYRIGARTRLMPGGRVAIIATRWAKGDLIGRLQRDMVLNTGADQFEVVEFPAILNEHTDNEKALWPEFFDLEALHRTRNSMPTYQWNAQYQQNPTGETSAILKRDYWKHWEKVEPPKCEYIIMTVDAAAEKGNRNDFTAMTTWGVWFNEETNMNNLILLNAVKERMEFPELKAAALQWYKDWEPDSFIVEKKSSGTPLYQELRRIGIPVSEFTPHRGTGDKVARVNAVADIVKSGLVWVPSTRWADQLVEEAAEFPNGEHDDLVDCLSMALARFRQGGFLTLPSDEEDEVQYFKSRRGGYY